MDDQTDIVTTTSPSVRKEVNPNFTNNTPLDDTNRRETKGETTTRGHEHSRAGISANLSFGQFWGALGWSSHESEDSAGVAQPDKEYVAGYVGMSFSDSTSGWLGYSTEETENVVAEPSKIAAGLYHNMGGGLQLWYEGGSTDKDVAGADDEVVHHIGIRYDF